MSIPLALTVLVKILEVAMLLLQIGLNELNGNYHVMCSLFVFLFLLLLLYLFLFFPFWFNTQKGEDHLSHAAERSSSHILQHLDGCCVYTELKADPIEFHLALIEPYNAWCPVPCSANEADKNSSLCPPQSR